MRTLTSDLPEQMAEELAEADPKFVIQVLQAGMQKVRQVPESATEHPYITKVARMPPSLLGGGLLASLENEEGGPSFAAQGSPCR